MSHTALVGTLARNSAYFGEAAEEFIVSLRDMEFSNTDLLSATQRLARTTPAPTSTSTSISTAAASTDRTVITRPPVSRP